MPWRTLQHDFDLILQQDGRRRGLRVQPSGPDEPLRLSHCGWKMERPPAQQAGRSVGRTGILRVWAQTLQNQESALQWKKGSSVKTMGVSLV